MIATLRTKPKLLSSFYSKTCFTRPSAAYTAKTHHDHVSLKLVLRQHATSYHSAATNGHDRKAELERRFGGPKQGDTIIVAMSGGVDSSLCASLLRRSPLNFDLRAVYMRNWNTLDESGDFEPGSGGASGCEWQREWKDVQEVCKYLGDIPLQMKDLSKEYWNYVFEPALDVWADGRTPNPDVTCNREIKFGALVRALFEEGDEELKHAAQEGRAWLATGHYAGTRWIRDASGLPVPLLTRCKDSNKDQTYYLSSVTQDALRLAHFPLTNMLKTEVKALAREHGLPTADREESMGLCFVGERRPSAVSSSSPGNHTCKTGKNLPTAGLASAGFNSFLESYLPSVTRGDSDSTEDGPIINLETGEQVGVHKGLHTLTVGQNARIAGGRAKLFVARKDSSRQFSANGKQRKPSIYVVEGRHHPALLCRRLRVELGQFNWSGALPAQLVQGDGRLSAVAQVRHRQFPMPCTVTLMPPKGNGVDAGEDAPSRVSENAAVEVEFADPADAVAPGQVVALWTEDGVTLGSGMIDSTTTMYDIQQQQQ